MSRSHKPKHSDVRFEIECMPDPESVEGAVCIDPKTDQEWEAETLARIADGDVWGWCCVRVHAIDGSGARASSGWLGGCQYRDEADFRACDYFKDMCQEAEAALYTFDETRHQSIVTRFHPPNGNRGARMSARTYAGRIYVAYDDGPHDFGNHLAAARAMARKRGWPGNWKGALLPDGDYVWVNVKGDA